MGEVKAEAGWAVAKVAEETVVASAAGELVAGGLEVGRAEEAKGVAKVVATAGHDSEARSHRNRFHTRRRHPVLQVLRPGTHHWRPSSCRRSD